MGDQVRQRGGGGDNPLIIDLGSSQRKQPQSNLGGKVRGGTQKHAFGAFMPIIVVIGCIGIAALVGVIAIIGTNSYVTREIAKTENSDHLLIENTLLKEQLKILEKERANQPSESTTNTVTTNEKADRKIKQLITYKARMHQEIQTISKRQLYEKYGKGPYKVQIDVEFDPSSNIYSATKSGGKIIIQMADANDMPATVYLFLEQVTKGLMSGCSFHRNAHHVLQGGPASNFIHTKAKHHDFKEANLDGVPFQEYSPNFPHIKYTLGYAGRPGGPDFYISTVDNTQNHGPGGQGSYEDPGEADPCFAKVIEGFDIVDLMHKSKVKPGGYNHMQHNIAIREMKLMQN